VHVGGDMAVFKLPSIQRFGSPQIDDAVAARLWTEQGLPLTGAFPIPATLYRTAP
jgi:hypothetical protein